MKKIRIYFEAALLFLLLLLSLPLLCWAETSEYSFSLPKNLREIDEAAFEGTAAQNVFLQENVEIIQNNAFSGMQALQTIYMSQGVRYIADDAFDGSHMLIIGWSNSYAEEWAKNHHVDFIRVDYYILRQSDEQQKKKVPLECTIPGLLIFILLAIGSKRETREHISLCLKERIEFHQINYYFP